MEFLFSYIQRNDVLIPTKSALQSSDRKSTVSKCDDVEGGERDFKTFLTAFEFKWMAHKQGGETKLQCNGEVFKRPHGSQEAAQTKREEKTPCIFLSRLKSRDTLYFW